MKFSCRQTEHTVFFWSFNCICKCFQLQRSMQSRRIDKINYLAKKRAVRNDSYKNKTIVIKTSGFTHLSHWQFWTGSSLHRKVESRTLLLTNGMSKWTSEFYSKSRDEMVHFAEQASSLLCTVIYPEISQLSSRRCYNRPWCIHCKVGMQSHCKLRKAVAPHIHPVLFKCL